MEFVNQLIFLAGVLFIASILASTVTPRLGVPLLLVFLLVGMLAGVDGIGGIEFDDYRLANLAATAALAVILFDGGLRTRIDTFRVSLKPALSLASLGVVLTAGITGAFAAWLLDLKLAEGLLIGAIVASTDAAAVFSLLHNSAVHLNQRVTSLLEIESGTNDPMAVFLTLALIQYLQTPETFGVAASLLFLAQQMGLGGLIGWIGGRLVVGAMNRLEMSESLYPLLALFSSLLIYGAAALVDGSGFLAVYLAGVMLGQRPVRGGASLRRFHDGIAWMAQIGMFVVLGLLVTPSHLTYLALPGLLVAGVLIAVARPLAVLASLAPFRFPWREQAFVSWVGLRGSVPIVLATYPWLAGLPDAELYFNVSFFIVLVSLVIQGWTIAPAARLLGLQMPASADLIQRTDIDLPGQRGYEIVSYRIGPDSRLVGLKPKELPIRDISRVISVARKGRLLHYREWGKLRAGDYVSLLVSQKELPALDEVFRARREDPGDARQRYFGEFHIDPNASLAAVAGFYGASVPDDTADPSVAAAFARYTPNAVVGDRLRLGGIELIVRRMEGGRIIEVGLRLPHEERGAG